MLIPAVRSWASSTASSSAPLAIRWPTMPWVRPATWAAVRSGLGEDGRHEIARQDVRGSLDVLLVVDRVCQRDALAVAAHSVGGVRDDDQYVAPGLHAERRTER